ncbi:MAG: hypothetical protein NT120_00385 [Candidatus Aenigmarchaeota archaeon]|nr:hypothetical protein [Candidatus Aenigmarchaeota archaeon]
MRHQSNGVWDSYYNYYCSSTKTSNVWLPGFGYLGVDHFSDDAPILKQGGFLRQNFNEGSEYIVTSNENELNKLVKSANFNGFKNGIEALGARVAWTKYMFLTDVKNMGVDTNSLTDDQVFFWTYYYFNTGQGNGKKELTNHVANGKLNDYSFMTASDKTITNGCKVRYNSIMRLATYKAIKTLGIFS